MAEKTKIEWCHHTWSPWWGCTKVSSGCAHCYADALSNRWGLKIWGAEAPRRMFGEKHWQDPIRWNKAAAAAGVRKRIFPSMCDVFEDRGDLDEPRKRMLDLITRTPNLDWLLLTKRPENVLGMTDPHWGRDWPKNVWLGTSVEDQAAADKRIPHLLRCPAVVRFLSCEPLLGAVDITREFCAGCYEDNDGVCSCHGHIYNGINLVIVGGESGPKARPMHPDWARSLRDQCVEAGVPFFFKQYGEWIDGGDSHKRAEEGLPRQSKSAILNMAGGCGFHGVEPRDMHRVGKAKAGRMLDGRTWDQMPEVKP